MKNRFLFFSFSMLALNFSCHSSKPASFHDLVKSFCEGYQQLNIPSFTYDYKEYFKAVASPKELEKQQRFFIGMNTQLQRFAAQKLSLAEKIQSDHILYEIDFNLERITLEKAWIIDGREIPEGGLARLKNHETWYRLFVQRYTGLSLSAADIMSEGKKEVRRVQGEIKRIQQESGFNDSISFYQFLKGDSFFLTDKKEVERAFEKTDSTVRRHLKSFMGVEDIPKVYAMEWPNANANTPPGIYLNEQNNSFGKNVFQYNFFSGRYNRRAVEWLYMHEAIPGHHLQFTLRNTRGADSLQRLLLYPGNFEGWGCYVEYYGRELGLYNDPYSELGKWEWDLVRSARLVIDAGIHNEGWSREQALKYWKENIPNQDEISLREVTRVTNWTAQALSYKIGALCIQGLREKVQLKYGVRFSEALFHQTYLSFGMRPLQVIKQNFEAAYEAAMGNK